MLSRFLWAMVTMMSGRAACAALLACPAGCGGHAIVQDSVKTVARLIDFALAMDGFSARVLEALKACTGTLFGAGGVFAAADALQLATRH